MRNIRVRLGQYGFLSCRANWLVRRPVAKKHVLNELVPSKLWHQSKPNAIELPLYLRFR
jgi:hypothetical protein